MIWLQPNPINVLGMFGNLLLLALMVDIDLSAWHWLTNNTTSLHLTLVDIAWPTIIDIGYHWLTNIHKLREILTDDDHWSLEICCAKPELLLAVLGQDNLSRRTQALDWPDLAIICLIYRYRTACCDSYDSCDSWSSLLLWFIIVEISFNCD